MESSQRGRGPGEGGEVSLKDRVAFLMSIKEEGRPVTFEHIFEKVSRDVAFLTGSGVTEGSVMEALGSIASEGYVTKKGGAYYRSEKLDRYVLPLVAGHRDALNRSYYLVFVAERYYPIVADYMLPYLSNRPLSAVKVFSGKKDPIREVEPIFVRYAKYKPKPVHLTVSDASDLMRLVHDHCVDFIPYVHGFEGVPDVFLVDLDLGDEIAGQPDAFRYSKHVALLTYEVLREAGCLPLLKFSGSRGFQVLCRLEPSPKPLDFPTLRSVVRSVQARVEERLVSDEVGRLYPSLHLERPYTTSSVDKKELRAKKVLVDWSSMKPEGDYRAPLSIHYKTGLASLPLEPSQLMSFERAWADPLTIAQGRKDLSFARNLPLTPPEGLLSLL